MISYIENSLNLVHFFFCALRDIISLSSIESKSYVQLNYKNQIVKGVKLGILPKTRSRQDLDIVSVYRTNTTKITTGSVRVISASMTRKV